MVHLEFHSKSQKFEQLCTILKTPSRKEKVMCDSYLSNGHIPQLQLHYLNRFMSL